MRKISMKKSRGASTVAAAVSLALVGSFVHPVVAPEEAAVAVAAEKGSSADAKTDPQNDGDSKKDPFADLPENCLPTILGTTIPLLFLLPLALGSTLHIPGFASMSSSLDGVNRQIGEALGYNYGPLDEAVKQHDSIYDVSHAKLAPEHPMPPAPPAPQGPDFIGGAAAVVLSLAALGLSLGMCLVKDEETLTNDLVDPIYPGATFVEVGSEKTIEFGRFLIVDPSEGLPKFGAVGGAEDADFELVTPIDGITVDEATGDITVSKSVEAGLYVLHIKVTYADGSVDEVATAVRVGEVVKIANLMDPGYIQEEGSNVIELKFISTGSKEEADPQPEPKMVELVDAAPQGITLDAATGAITVGDDAEAGLHVLKVKVTYADDSTDDAVATAYVTPVAPAQP